MNEKYDIIIVGAGPAGLTSALYALRSLKKVLILEEKNYGGQIVNAHQIENYPGIEMISGFDFAHNLYQQVKHFNGKIVYEMVLKIEPDGKVITDHNEYQASAVILATGVNARKLNLENEDALLGKGISYCATCDGNFYKGKEVAVVGGGNTAVEDALYLADIAKKVYIIHRRDTFRAEESLLSSLKKKENVEWISNATVTKLNGSDKLESIVISNKEEFQEIKVDGLFVAIGQIPNNQRFANVVDLNEDGYIKIKDGVHTKTNFIYAVGDAREKELRQLTTAVSDGSIAAMTAIKELEMKKNSPLEEKN